MCWIGWQMCTCMYTNTHMHDGMNFILRIQHDILFLMRNGVFGVQKLIVCLDLVMTELHETSASYKAHSCSAGPEIHYFYGTGIFITMFTRSYHWIPSLSQVSPFNAHACISYVSWSIILFIPSSFQHKFWMPFSWLYEYYLPPSHHLH